MHSELKARLRRFTFHNSLNAPHFDISYLKGAVSSRQTGAAKGRARRRESVIQLRVDIKSVGKSVFGFCGAALGAQSPQPIAHCGYLRLSLSLCQALDTQRLIALTSRRRPAGRLQLEVVFAHGLACAISVDGSAASGRPELPFALAFGLRPVGVGGALPRGAGRAVALGVFHVHLYRGPAFDGALA